MAATASPEWISEMQARVRARRWHPPMSDPPRLSKRTEWRRSARWWDLEAMRGYDHSTDEYGMNSSDRSKMYAANLRWCVELLDAGHPVIGMRFDAIVKTYARVPLDEFVRRHAERICGERHIKPRKK